MPLPGALLAEVVLERRERRGCSLPMLLEEGEPVRRELLDLKKLHASTTCLKF